MQSTFTYESDWNECRREYNKGTKRLYISYYARIQLGHRVVRCEVKPKHFVAPRCLHANGAKATQKGIQSAPLRQPVNGKVVSIDIQSLPSRAHQSLHLTYWKFQTGSFGNTILADTILLITHSAIQSSRICTFERRILKLSSRIRSSRLTNLDVTRLASGHLLAVMGINNKIRSNPDIGTIFSTKSWQPVLEWWPVL